MWPLSLAVFLTTALGTSALSAGCGNTTSPSLTSGGTGSSNKLHFTTSTGTHRTYYLHIPTDYDINTPTPLIFSFHGRDANGLDQESNTGLSETYLNPSMFVVYPDGLNGQWQGDPAATDYDDVAFVLELLVALSDDFCVDEQRVYSSGFSNGAGFSLNILACDEIASTKIAAFMGASAAAYQGNNSDKDCEPETVGIPCTPGRTGIPILETHGGADDTIDYHGGPRRNSCLPSIPHFMTAWAERNGLTSGNVSRASHGGKVETYRFEGEDETGLVESWWVEGMGHEWPWASAGCHINASPIAMSFFGNYTLDGVRG